MQPPLRTIRAIEGLRALAVASVIAFHLFPSVARGGFLGVDLFFVVSGYVITTLLVRRLQVSGRVSIKEFYSSRARRLGPAMLALIALTLVVAQVTQHPGLQRAVKDVPFILSGTYNWRLADFGLSYFDEWTPPLFRHMWSLAVETQFYLLWPLLLWALTYRYTSRQIAGRLLAAASIALAVDLLVGLGPIAPGGAAAHYFATHTHVLGLMLGSALALVWRPDLLHAELSARPVLFINTLGALALAATVALLITVSETSSVYNAAFGMVAISTTLLIAAIVHPASRVGRILGSAPLVVVGQRSYSLYLWHWPVQQLVPYQGIWSKVFILVSTIALAEVSYRFVETPFRVGRGISSAFRSPLRLTPVLGAGAIAMSALLAVPLGASQPGLIPVATAEVPVVDATSSTPLTAPGTYPRSTVFVGDSVLLGVRRAVPEALNVRVFDAEVGRQARDLEDKLVALDPQFYAGSIVINLGNNGQLRHEEVVAIFGELQKFQRAVVVNARVPRAWQDRNNALLARVVQKYPSIDLMDWLALSQGHGEYFGPDNIHLSPSGATAYADELTRLLTKPLITTK